MRAVVVIALGVAISGCLAPLDEPSISSPPDNPSDPAPVAQVINEDLSYTWAYCVGSESPQAVCGVGGIATRRGASVPLDGWTAHLDVNLTWEPTTPLAEKMYFWALAGVATPNGFQPRAAITEPTGGTSPFRLALDPEMENGEDILFLTEPYCEDPGPVCAHLAIDQRLRIDGTVWTRPSDGDEPT